MDMNRGELDSANHMPPSDTAINFCLSIVMDTTGSMNSAINSVKESIENLLKAELLLSGNSSLLTDMTDVN